jgi:hypothetical protein
MDAEIDYELTPNQWEALKALRLPAPKYRAAESTAFPNRRVVATLVALQLAAMIGDRPVITSKGRSVLLRGSPRLWDVAA